MDEMSQESTCMYVLGTLFLCIFQGCFFKGGAFIREDTVCRFGFPLSCVLGSASRWASADIFPLQWKRSYLIVNVSSKWNLLNDLEEEMFQFKVTVPKKLLSCLNYDIESE